MVDASEETSEAAIIGETGRRRVRRVRRADRVPQRASGTTNAADAMSRLAGTENLDLEQLRRARTEFYDRPSEERIRKSKPKNMTNLKAARSPAATPVRRATSKQSRDKTTPRLGKGSHAGATITARDSTKNRAAADNSAYVYGPPDRHESGHTARKPARSSTSSPKSRERTSRSNMSQSRLQSDSSKRASDKPARLSAKRMSNPQIGNATAKSSPAPSRSATPKVVRSTSMQEKPTSASPRPGVQRSNTTATSQGQPPTSSAPTAAEPSMGKTGTATGPKQRRGSVGLFAALFGPSPQRPEKKVACLTCAADDVPMSKSAKLACGHRMCHECLKRVFTMSISDPQHMPPRCCTQDHIPLRHVDRLFNDKFKMQWNKKYQEYTTKNRIYCPTRGCGEWIRPGNIQIDSSSGRKYGKCSRCKTKICCLCNAKWHTRRECPNDEETKRFIEVAKQEGWQRCFNCKAMVELKEGCNHMTCRCGAEFCMICARRWKTCDCPWFNHGAIADGDRLNHFNVPQPQAGAPPGYGHYRRATADDIGGYRGGALAYHEELGQRRRQEQEDEILARRLQILGMEDDDEDGHEDAIVDAVLNDYATRRRARRQHQHLVQQQQLQRRREREMAREEQARREYGQQGDIFGIGNTTDHFMNEDYVHARNPANLFTGHFFDNAAAIANQMRGLDDRQALNGSWAPPGLLVEEQPRRDTRTSKRNRRNTNTQTREGEDASPAANPTHGRMSSDLTTANVLNRPGAGRRRHTLMGSDGKIGSWLHNIG